MVSEGINNENNEIEMNEDKEIEDNFLDIDEIKNVNVELDVVEKKNIETNITLKIDKITDEDKFEISMYFPTMKRQTHMMRIKKDIGSDVIYYDVKFREFINKIMEHGYNLSIGLIHVLMANKELMQEVIDYVSDNFMRFKISVSPEEDLEAFKSELKSKVLYKPITLSLIRNFNWEIRNRIIHAYVREILKKGYELNLVAYYSYSISDGDVYVVGYISIFQKGNEDIDIKKIETINNVIYDYFKENGYSVYLGVFRFYAREMMFYYEMVRYESFTFGISIYVKGKSIKIYFSFRYDSEDAVFINPNINKSLSLDEFDISDIFDVFNEVVNQFSLYLNYEFSITEIIGIANYTLELIEDKVSESFTKTIFNILHYHGTRMKSMKLNSYIIILMRNFNMTRYKDKISNLKMIEDFISLSVHFLLQNE